jgi:DNA repair exonuclease SbcCD nuclease subunit
MAVAVIGDLHFGMRINDERFIDYQITEWKKFIGYCKENDIRRMIILGDFFDNRNFISIKILDIVLNEIASDIKVLLLIGNHDTLFKNTSKVNTPDLIFKKHKHIKIVQAPEEIEIDGVPCLFVPWINKENWDESLAAIKNSKAKYCFGHFELQGFEMTNGIKCTGGMNASTLRKFKWVFSGHFHLVQKKGNIFYLGSFYQTTWADCGDQKFAYTLELAQKIAQTQRLDDFDLKQVPMARSIFKKIYLTADKPITKKHVESAADCYVKVYLNYKMKAKDEKLLSKLMESAIKCDVIDISLLLDAPDDGDVDNEDFMEIFEGYMEIQDDLDADLKAGVIKLMKETYNEALS